MSRTSSKQSSQNGSHPQDVKTLASVSCEAGVSTTVAIRNLPRHYRVSEVFGVMHQLGFKRQVLATSRLRFRCGVCLMDFKKPALAQEFVDRADGFLLQMGRGTPRTIEVSMVQATSHPSEARQIDEWRGHKAVLGSPVQPELISSVLQRSGVDVPLRAHAADGTASGLKCKISRMAGQMPLQQDWLRDHGVNDLDGHGCLALSQIAFASPTRPGLVMNGSDGNWSVAWRSQVAGQVPWQQSLLRGYSSASGYDFAEVAGKPDRSTLWQDLEVLARLSL